MDNINDELRKHFARLGAKGGAVKSEAKAAAARKNGKRGGLLRIQDEFSSEPDRRKRYQLRKAKREAQCQ